jgi:hypothetical protein
MNLEGPLIMDAETFLDLAPAPGVSPMYQVILVSGVGLLNWTILHTGHIVAFRYLSGSGEVNINRGSSSPSVATLPTGFYSDRLLDLSVGSLSSLWIPVTAAELLLCVFQGTAYVQIWMSNEDT